MSTVLWKISTPLKLQRNWYSWNSSTENEPKCLSTKQKIPKQTQAWSRHHKDPHNCSQSPLTQGLSFTPVAFSALFNNCGSPYRWREKKGCVSGKLSSAANKRKPSKQFKKVKDLLGSYKKKPQASSLKCNDDIKALSNLPFLICRLLASSLCFLGNTRWITPTAPI